MQKDNTIKPVYETENSYVIKDIRPQAKIHLLSIPKSHKPSSVIDLTSDHIDLLEEMKQGCLSYFKENAAPDAENVRMGFHIPDSISVGHLHLHCQIPPYINQKAFDKFHEDSFPYVELDHVIEALRQGLRVRRQKKHQDEKLSLFYNPKESQTPIKEKTE